MFCLLTRGIPTSTLKQKMRFTKVTGFTLSEKNDTMVQQTGLNAFSSGEEVTNGLWTMLCIWNLNYGSIWEKLMGLEPCFYSHTGVKCHLVTDAVFMQPTKGILQLERSLSG